MIDELAESTVLEADITSPPVDPFVILKKDGIRYTGNNYGTAFDGRLEWRGNHFNLYYNTKYGNEQHPRIRFSVAHEIGHYTIPYHRKALQQAVEGHSSYYDYFTDNQIEREANEFAANILMPNILFQPYAKTIPDLGKLIEAACIFNTSITSTVIRYIDSSDFACLMFVSDGHRVNWHIRNELFIQTRAKGLKNGFELPANSCTSRLALGDIKLALRDYAEEIIDVDEWFSSYRSFDGDVLEQVIPIGQYGYLTILCVEEQ